MRVKIHSSCRNRQTHRSNIVESIPKLFVLVRPPADKWYELKNKTFTQEAMRCKRMIRSPGLQQLERRTREIVLDLHRTQTKMA